MLYLVKAYHLIDDASMKKTKLVSELRAALEKGLKENGHTKMKKIEISCDGQQVFIRGKVSNYYARQMILEVVKQIAGGLEIRDNVTVG